MALPTLSGRSQKAAGFTFLELMVVIAVIGILATIALPSLRNLPRRANEAALKTNLRTMRDVIDQYYGAWGKYPASLETLVEEGLMRAIPDDITGSSDTWVPEYEPLGEDDDPLFPGDVPIEPLPGEEARGIWDVRSGSELVSLRGEAYSEW
ncbi:MAG: type II secretion system protein [Acidobacteriota bacterium]|nr:type II secretion system protein [Acidobacteriota bacterium]